ncbi:MAG: hypothetical protein JSR97_01105 [Verrucomicrobia bacterium]|nr:hypothetical protein [Verrucomicrobiota bacterium]
MNYIDFFKLQAKNLFRDYQTRTKVFDQAIGDYLYEYNPKYFDIDCLILDYDINEDDFSLMTAQHYIAKLVGFRKWTDLVKSSDAEQELAKLLFDNQDKVSAEDWEMYIHSTEHDNNLIFDADTRLEIFKKVFENVDGHVSTFPDYRLPTKSS